MYNQITNSHWKGAFIGLFVRRTLNKETTFRVRTGNGFAGSRCGSLYQDKFDYVVPTSINNAQGQAARDAFKQAVLEWQTTLTEEQKKQYRRKANHRGKLSGYNLYISERIKELLA